MIEFTCKQCGYEGTTYPSQSRKFCSQSCRSRWNADHIPMPTKPRRGITKPCPTCGAPVYRSRNDSQKRFCSNQCRNLGNRNGSQRVCERCGESFYVTPSIGERRFCSRDCYEAVRTVKSATGRQHNGREVIRDHAGYMRIWEPDHPAASQGRVLEHRWVVEQSIGRHLATDEHVHHVNSVKDDNRLENLEVMDAQDHRLLTASETKDRRLAEADELAEYRKRFGPLNT